MRNTTKLILIVLVIIFLWFLWSACFDIDKAFSSSLSSISNKQICGCQRCHHYSDYLFYKSQQQGKATTLQNLKQQGRNALNLIRYLIPSLPSSSSLSASSQSSSAASCLTHVPNSLPLKSWFDTRTTATCDRVALLIGISYVCLSASCFAF
jgi:hypothetical protein